MMMVSALYKTKFTKIKPGTVILSFFLQKLVVDLVDFFMYVHIILKKILSRTFVLNDAVSGEPPVISSN
jgi:hypothetical protein